ncbi:periplasmic heavy metal sensor [Aerophototrophica crusticola]|uniref:Periplasmic heavy metal sensor n=1 Tax=Aerophototrophica crusticola TaxID=1709002 RepID=A0A858R5M3_9PROT|nr:periplasmic heavy metal sensor [Rhodospirillaceae bacterium B3]
MRRSTLFLTIALVISVSLNLLVAGLMLGHHLSGRGGRGGNPSLDRLFATVPDEIRREVRRAMSEDGQAREARRQALREARQQVAAALGARPFDPAAADAALANLRAHGEQVADKLHATLVRTMAEAQANGTLPPPRVDSRDGHDDDDPPGPPPRR